MKKRLLSILITLCMVLVFWPVTAFAEGGIKEVNTEKGFKAALNDAGVAEIHIIGDFKYNDSLESDKTIQINEGVTLTLGGYKTTVSGTIINNGTITVTSSDQCVWTAQTSGTGKLVATNKMWGEYQTYVDYGCVPDAMLEGSNCRINIVKNLSVRPTVSLPDNMHVGDTITPAVTNLIDGVDLTQVFKFTWKDGNSNQIYNGAASPILTKTGTLKLSVATKNPYVMRSSSGAYGSIDTTGTVTKKVFNTLYVDAVNGSNSNLGDTAATPLKTLYAALDAIADNGTIVLLGSCSATDMIFDKNVTVKSAEGQKYTLSLIRAYVKNGIALTFDTVELSDAQYLRADQSTPGTGTLLLKNCTGSVAITSGDMADVTLENSQLTGTVYASSALTLQNSSLSGRFNTKDFTAAGDCTFMPDRNTVGVISGTITTEKPVTIVPYKLQRGEKLVEVPADSADAITQNFILKDTQNGTYAIKRGVLYNGTYLGISQRVDSKTGKLAITNEPIIAAAVQESNISRTDFDPAPLTVKSAAWSGNTDPAKWSHGDVPELTVTLSVNAPGNPFSHFDNSFSVADLKIYSWKDVDNFASFDDAALNTGVTCLLKDGQGVSADGKTFTFTIRYPAVMRLTQIITVDTTDRTASCGEELDARKVTANSAVSYESSDPAIASVDPLTGRITAHKAGEVIITIKAAQTDIYNAAETSYKLIVSHKYSDDWKHNEAERWKECACGDKIEKAPLTGDNNDLIPWFALLFIGGGAAIGTTIVSKKRKYNR